VNIPQPEPDLCL